MLPLTQDLFLDDAEKSRLDKVIMSNTHSEKDTQIVAQAVKATNLVEVRRAYAKVRKTYPLANQIVEAYINETLPRVHRRQLLSVSLCCGFLFV